MPLLPRPFVLAQMLPAPVRRAPSERQPSLPQPAHPRIPGSAARGVLGKPGLRSAARAEDPTPDTGHPWSPALRVFWPAAEEGRGVGSAAPRPARGKGRWGTAGGEGGGTRVELSPGALPLGWRPSLTLARAGPRRGHGLPPCVLMPAPQPRRVCGSAAGPSRCPGAHLDEIPNSPPEVLGAGHPATCAPGAQEMSLLSLFSERIPPPAAPSRRGHTRHPDLPAGPQRGDPPATGDLAGRVSGQKWVEL